MTYTTYTFWLMSYDDLSKKINIQFKVIMLYIRSIKLFKSAHPL